MSSSKIVASPLSPELNGRDKPKRVGLIALSTDLTSEGDLTRAFAAIDLALHVTRVAFANPTTPENLLKMSPHLTDAASLIASGTALNAICYSCTAASAVIGDEEVTRAIQEARPNVPVVTPSAAARAALQVLGAQRVAVLTPYVRETSQAMADYFERNGLEVLQLHYMGMEDDRDMARVTCQSIIDAAIAADVPEAEAMFISCTGLPAVGAIAAIEQRLGKPVVTSNQASAWMLSRLSGFAEHHPVGWGRLFDFGLPGAPAVAAQ